MSLRWMGSPASVASGSSTGGGPPATGVPGLALVVLDGMWSIVRRTTRWAGSCWSFELREASTPIGTPNVVRVTAYGNCRRETQVGVFVQAPAVTVLNVLPWKGSA